VHLIVRFSWISHFATRQALAGLQVSQEGGDLGVSHLASLWNWHPVDVQYPTVHLSLVAQRVLSNVCSHFPFAVSHLSTVHVTPSSQEIKVFLHPSFASQESVVHKLLSLQLFGMWRQPTFASQTSLVHLLLSLHNSLLFQHFGSLDLHF
jgi:hypothetical protein